MSAKIPTIQFTVWDASKGRDILLKCKSYRIDATTWQAIAALNSALQRSDSLKSEKSLKRLVCCDYKKVEDYLKHGKHADKTEMLNICNLISVVNDQTKKTVEIYAKCHGYRVVWNDTPDSLGQFSIQDLEAISAKKQYDIGDAKAP